MTKEKNKSQSPVKLRLIVTQKSTSQEAVPTFKTVHNNSTDVLGFRQEKNLQLTTKEKSSSRIERSKAPLRHRHPLESIYLAFDKKTQKRFKRLLDATLESHSLDMELFSNIEKAKIINVVIQEMWESDQIKLSLEKMEIEQLLGIIRHYFNDFELTDFQREIEQVPSLAHWMNTHGKSLEKYELYWIEVEVLLMVLWQRLFPDHPPMEIIVAQLLYYISQVNQLQEINQVLDLLNKMIEQFENAAPAQMVDLIEADEYINGKILLSEAFVLAFQRLLKMPICDLNIVWQLSTLVIKIFSRFYRTNEKFVFDFMGHCFQKLVEMKEYQKAEEFLDLAVEKCPMNNTVLVLRGDTLCDPKLTNFSKDLKRAEMLYQAAEYGTPKVKDKIRITRKIRQLQQDRKQLQLPLGE